MIKIKPFAIIALALSTILLNACQGQKSKNQSKTTELPQKSENSENNGYSSFLDFDNQISQVVRTIFQDSKGYLWFGTENGAFKLNKDALTRVNGIISESGKDVTIKEITEDRNGKIWFAHTDGVSSIEGDIVTNYYESDGLISNDAWCIAADRNGRIWIGTIDGVCVFNGQKFKKFTLPEGKINSTLGISSTKMVHSIFEDSKGTLWFSSNAGLFSYASNVLTNVSEKLGIATNFVNEIFEDKNGVFWVSTSKGLYHIIDNKAKNITKGIIETGKGIGSIAEDNDGNLWFVSNQHFLFVYNGEKLMEYKKTENNKGPVIFQIFKDRNNRLWCVGYGGAFRLEKGKFVNITKNGPW